LLLCTSVAGVLDGEGNVIREIKAIDKSALSLARTDKSSVGLGGMTSKLTFARLATQMGIKTVIFSMAEDNAILKAVKDEIGTVCLAQQKKVSSRNKWLASGSLISGLVKIDKGALEALRKRKSLLAVGVTQIVEGFEIGEVFHIADEEGTIQAVAKSKVDSTDLKTKRKNLEIAHADDIVLL